MRSISRILAGLLSLGWVSTGLHPASAETIPLAKSGFWTIYVYLGEGGKFGYCGMKTGSNAGAEIFTLTIDGRGFHIYLDDANWRLNKGDKFDSVVVIGDQRWSGPATVYMQNGVEMNFGFDTNFGTHFVRGREMKFQIGKFARSLNLSGADDAIGKMAACLKQYMPSSNPFGEASEKANPFR